MKILSKARKLGMDKQGFEPWASSVQAKRSTELIYLPINI